MAVGRSPKAGDVDPGPLLAVVSAGFAKRRKNIRNSLISSTLFGGDRDLVAAVLARAGLDGRKRAEQLDLEEFVRLTKVAIALGAVRAAHGRSDEEEKENGGDLD
jgi:16S rRNA A1518/A1519 N6-dimethyltransferase RsmA/KsgA/DIM1 with predicted DNA glycosylase/AP lyase activity